jgi:integrase
VTRQIDHEEQGERVPLKSKTLTDRRTVPLMTELVEGLRDHRAKLAEWGRAKPGAWVFPNADGGHITYAPRSSDERSPVYAFILNMSR